MLVYLDTCIVIYAVEGQAPFQQRAQSHIGALEVAGNRFIISDLTRGECLKRLRAYPRGSVPSQTADISDVPFALTRGQVPLASIESLSRWKR